MSPGSRTAARDGHGTIPGGTIHIVYDVDGAPWSCAKQQPWMFPMFRPSVSCLGDRILGRRMNKTSKQDIWVRKS